MLLRCFRLIALGLLACSACKPAPGSSCDTGEARCLDSQRSLVCDEGKFVESPCKGKAGCSTLQETTTCDISGNQPGDVCVKADEGVATCLSEAAMLVCHDRRFESVPCHGPAGCRTAGERTNCDQSVAEVGDVCKKENAKACSTDKSQVLSCTDGRMTAEYLCRGDGHCSSAGGKLACDQTIAMLGDRCDKGLNGHVACSKDRTSLFVCHDEEFVPNEKCRPGTVCTVSGSSTACAKP
jgi:hypothetical protein